MNPQLNVISSHPLGKGTQIAKNILTEAVLFGYGDWFRVEEVEEEIEVVEIKKVITRKEIEIE